MTSKVNGTYIEEWRQITLIPKEGGVGMRMKHRATMFKAISDEKRQRILKVLQKSETCMHRLAEETDIPQSSLSYHMKILREAGLVQRREDGKWTYYRICEEGAKRFIGELENLAQNYGEYFGK